VVRVIKAIAGQRTKSVRFQRIFAHSIGIRRPRLGGSLDFTRPHHQHNESYEPRSSILQRWTTL